MDEVQSGEIVNVPFRGLFELIRKDLLNDELKDFQNMKIINVTLPFQNLIVMDMTLPNGKN